MGNKSKREGKVVKTERIKLKKRKLVDKENLVESPKLDQICSENEPAAKLMKKAKSNKAEGEKKKNKLSRKKKREKEKGREANAGKVDQLGSEDEDSFTKLKYGGEGDSSHATDLGLSETQSKIENSSGPEDADVGINSRPYKSKKAVKSRKKDRPSSKKGNKLMEKGGEAKPDEVYHISSEDEDCSKGMKKWIMEYYQSRPGLKILQQRIDEFMAAHEEQEEQARKEREARAAEGGWTVVVHHKGRKKTTDSESGITVGSVAQAAVVDKMAKKKSKEVGLDFYRFQRREAQRNEVMMLQSKFEQDRKRIQQLRAARKFRPY